MNKKSLCLRSMIGIAALYVSSNISGQVLIGNYPPADDNSGNAVNIAAWKAYSFTMPAQAYDVTSIVLRLSSYSSGTSPNAGVGFFTDSSSHPGALIGSFFNNPPLAGSAAVGDFTFTPSGTFTLSANTTYWLVVSSQSGGFTFEAASAPPTPSGVATPGTFLRSTDSGDTWISTTIQNSFRINATPVPEPVHFALLSSAGLLGFAGARRFLRARKGSVRCS